MTYVIEKNIPIPEETRNSKQFGLPQMLRKMEIGDSIFCKGKTKTTQISYAIQKAKVGNENRDFAAVVDGGVRVWRTA